MDMESQKMSKMPWHYLDADVEVALTGPAFRLINEQKEKDPYTYNSICKKAQVFARMSPLDKE